MIRPVLLAAALSVAYGPTSLAGEEMPQDAETVLYWGAEHPVFLRLVLTVEGQTQRAAWDAAAGRLFDTFDHNRDGTLTADEGLSRLLALVSMELIAEEGSTERTQSSPSKLVRDAFPTLLRDRGINPFCIAPSPIAPQSPRAPMNLAAEARLVDDDLLLAILDDNGSGDLSARELLLSQRRKLDLDDDECLSARELLVARMFAADDLSSMPTAVRRMPAASAAPNSRLTVLTSPQSLRSVARELLLRYDDNRDGLLSIEELGLASGDAAGSDHDRSGRLDLEETEQMLRRPVAALSLECRWPQTDSPQRRTVALGKEAVVVELAARSLPFDRSAIEQLFGQLDGDRNEYLDPAETDASPQVKRAFRLIDNDNDDKLLSDEVIEYAERVAMLAPRQLVATFQSQSRNLFERIDVNRDARLSAVELADFSAHTAQWNGGGNGTVTAADIASSARLTIGPAASWTVGQGGAAKPSPALRRPLWFTRMDRNQDGVVSGREFLGPAQLFVALDTDRSHLLDAAEAAAGDYPKN